MEANNGKNMHKEYWEFIFKEAIFFFKKNRKVLFYIVLFVLLSVAMYFGFLNYNPEFSFPFGTFSVNKEIVNEESENSNSKTLDRSIFDLAEEIRPGKLTSRERVGSINNIAGLQTQSEQGVIEDIGTDGLTLLIRGNSVNGSFGIVECDFSSSWKARLSLFKKDAEVKFTGTISNYDLSRDWIVLKNCNLL